MHEALKTVLLGGLSLASFVVAQRFSSGSTGPVNPTGIAPLPLARAPATPEPVLPASTRPVASGVTHTSYAEPPRVAIGRSGFFK